jgi:uncharacterized protein YjbI with pentapeptide repeats
MKNKINSRSVRMTAVNSRNTTSTSSFATITTTVFTTVNNYSGIDFSKIIDFSRYVFKGANLSNANFDNLDFENELNNNNGKKLILLTNKSKLDFLDFSGANCTGTSFIYTKMHNAKFQGATISNSNFGDADLTGANFSGLTMTDVSFSSANLTGANFSKTRIIRLEYSEIDFRDANFTNADFSGANFDYAEYNDADFTGADFTFSKINGSFIGVILNGTIFKNATLYGTFQVGNKNIQESSIFNNVIFSNANLEKISFSYYPSEIKIILRNVDFTGAIFSSNYDIFLDEDNKELAVIFENTKCPNGQITNNKCYS